jgi:hypothetical protein
MIYPDAVEYPLTFEFRGVAMQNVTYHTRQTYDANISPRLDYENNESD